MVRARACVRVCVRVRFEASRDGKMLQRDSGLVKGVDKGTARLRSWAHSNV